MGEGHRVCRNACKNEVAADLLYVGPEARTRREPPIGYSRIRESSCAKRRDSANVAQRRQEIGARIIRPPSGSNDTVTLKATTTTISADHRELWIWWGRYCAHMGSIDEALAAFSTADDVLSVIKLYWSQVTSQPTVQMHFSRLIQGDRETSLKIAQEKEDKASLFYLARQYASLGHIDKAIDLFADAGCVDNAVGRFVSTTLKTKAMHVDPPGHDKRTRRCVIRTRAAGQGCRSRDHRCLLWRAASVGTSSDAVCSGSYGDASADPDVRPHLGHRLPQSYRRVYSQPIDRNIWHRAR